jgi:UDPglucose 6-dehydrogenase
LFFFFLFFVVLGCDLSYLGKIFLKKKQKKTKKKQKQKKRKGKKMKIGFVGTGKLGLVVSLMYCARGHDLYCYDVNPAFYAPHADPIDMIYSEERSPDNNEPLSDWLRAPAKNSHVFDRRRYRHVDLQTVLNESELVFVAVQTPHEARFEGNTRLPEHERRDFDYRYLVEAMSLVAQASNLRPAHLGDVIVSVISTVLPGTVKKHVLPLLRSAPRIQLCYNPYFIAMGTVAHDCSYPEFVLLGSSSSSSSNYEKSNSEKGNNAVVQCRQFYRQTTSLGESTRFFVTSIENAEMIKVCYNTFISTKIALANTIMEMCHRQEASEEDVKNEDTKKLDCDQVMSALCMADQRLISPAYLKGGMGDGGGCHPRDNIAMSWLCRELGLGYNWFDYIMTVRERQTEFLADLLEKEHRLRPDLDTVILGTAFKPNTAIVTGSPAVLLCNILRERGLSFVAADPKVNAAAYQKLDLAAQPALYLVACAHDDFLKLKLAPGSVLIDPHRRFGACVPPGSKYVPVGRPS